MSNDIDFTQTRPPESRLRTLVRAYSHKPKNKFGDTEYVFMHVGKTGGTSISAFVRNCHEVGLRVPIVLNHNWSFKMARTRYPKANLIIVLRDPLERIISGFKSRLREGRPLGHPWRNEEAIAFAHFKSAEKFTDALSSDEAYDISAARFCFRSINHLRRGYRYQFAELNDVANAQRESLCVVRLEEIGTSIPEIIADLNSLKKQEVPALGTIHNAAVSTGSVLDRISEDDIRKIRGRLQMEYECYSRIKSYLSNS
ncbi:MAG: hypothetical protein ACSHXK_17525 [Oceanococcus sp.]